MAVAMTYTSLKDDIRRYLERGQPSDTSVYEQIPSLINLAERDIARKLKIQGFINVVTSSLVAGTSTYQKPDRWRRTISMNYATNLANTERKQIFPRDYEYCREYWPNANERGTPEYYADYDYQHWLIVPTPSANQAWEIVYYEQPPYLDDGTETNWLTDYAPQALLYGALVQAEPFLKNDERIGTWQALYTTAVNDLNVEDLKKILDRNSTRQEA
jgi:hypothetical protein